MDKTDAPIFVLRNEETENTKPKIDQIHTVDDDAGGQSGTAQK